MKNPIVIDLGAGPNKYPGSFGVDLNARAGADLACDIEQPLPLKDDSVDEIHSAHVLEHIKNLVQLMEEIYRVCKHDATVVISVPYYTSRGAFTDPEHIRFFTEYTFQRFEPPTYGINCNYKILSTEFDVVRSFRHFPKRVQKWCRRYLLNVVDSITVTMKVVKDASRKNVSSEFTRPTPSWKR